MALRQSKVDRTIAKQILKICIPMGFQYSFIYLSSCILQWVINGFGTSVIGAFTATSQIENLIQQPFTALGTAMATEYLSSSKCNKKYTGYMDTPYCIFNNSRIRYKDIHNCSYLFSY